MIAGEPAAAKFYLRYHDPRAMAPTDGAMKATACPPRRRRPAIAMRDNIINDVFNDVSAKNWATAAIVGDAP